MSATPNLTVIEDADDPFGGAGHIQLRLGDIKIHPNVQRALRHSWVHTITTNFDPKLFGDLVIGMLRDEPNTNYCIDGQHRRKAAIAIFGEDQMVPCRRYKDLTLEEMARRFIGLNKTHHVRMLDKFHVAVTAREPQETAVAELLSEFDLYVGEQRVPGCVRAPAALMRVYRRHGIIILRRTLGVLVDAWGKDDPDTFDGLLIRGVGLLLGRYPDFNDGVLARKMSREARPNDIIGHARSAAKNMGEPVEAGALNYLHHVYQTRRRRPAEALDVPASV